MEDFYICMELFEEHSYKDLVDKVIQTKQPSNGVLGYATFVQASSKDAAESMLFGIQLNLLSKYPPLSNSTLLTPLIDSCPVEIDIGEVRFYGANYWLLTPDEAGKQWHSTELAASIHHYRQWLKSPDAAQERPDNRYGVFLRSCDEQFRIYKQVVKRRKRNPIDTTTYSGRFAERLRMLRENVGFSVEELAEKTGIPRATLYEWEANKKIPGINRLPQLANSLGVAVRELLPEK